MTTLSVTVENCTAPGDPKRRTEREQSEEPSDANTVRCPKVDLVRKGGNRHHPNRIMFLLGLRRSIRNFRPFELWDRYARSC